MVAAELGPGLAATAGPPRRLGLELAAVAAQLAEAEIASDFQVRDSPVLALTHTNGLPCSSSYAP